MTNDEREALAKSRFLVLSAVRLAGALLVMGGFILIMGKWPLAGPENDRIIGTIFVLVGAFEFAVMPLLLSRQWKRDIDL